MAQGENSLEGKPVALSWFTRSTRRYTHLIVELMVIAIVIRLIGLVQPFVFQTLIDRVLPFQRISSLELILIILLGTTIFSVVLGILSGLLGTQLANRLASEMGGRIYDHSLKLPLRRLQRFSVGEQLARIGEIDTVRGFLTGTLADVILNLLFVIIYIGALLSLSSFLTMIVLIMLPLQMAAFGLIGPFLRARMQDRFQAGAHHQSRMVEAYGNPVTIKSVGAEDAHRNRVSQALDFSLFQGWRVAKLNVANGAIGELLGGVSVILVIYFGAQLVFVSELTLGQLIAFHLLAEKVAGPIFSLSTIWEKWQGLRIARLRLGDLLNPDAESDSGFPKLPDINEGRLSVAKLTFGYSPDVLVLNNVSLDSRPGIPTVIVGDSGCGKSTLAKLLCGLYRPWEGGVTLDDHVLHQHDPLSVRRHIGYVAQEPVLFAGSVLENLQMANDSATPEQIDVALKDSACEFVQRLPEGINTQVGERGQDLSGGQRQRIALARSLLTKPEVLVLDEPTSSLDEASAQAVMKTLHRLAKSKTIILITHRPDLIEGGKNIVDLNQLQAISANC